MPDLDLIKQADQGAGRSARPIRPFEPATKAATSAGDFAANFAAGAANVQALLQ
jgi:hypothetical protein